MDGRADPGPPLFWWSVKVACAILLIACLVARVLFFTPPLLGVPALAAQLLVLAGGGLLLWHERLLSRARRGEPALVMRGGLYRHVRHPMYLGEAVLNLGLALLADNAVALALWGLSVWALRQQALAEDRHLAALHPYEHRAWARRAGLLLPHLERIR